MATYGMAQLQVNLQTSRQKQQISESTLAETSIKMKDPVNESGGSLAAVDHVVSWDFSTAFVLNTQHAPSAAAHYRAPDSSKNCLT